MTEEGTMLGFFRRWSIAGALLGALGCAFAQSSAPYPDRPIRLVVAFVPGHQTENPDGAAGEGIVADPAGNLYAAENTLRGVTKYVKR